MSRAYPLRCRLRDVFEDIPHPGYGRTHCHTYDYLDSLGGYKVAICTASRFGYALRKIVEATAVGCKVVTDLPADEILPHINGNLVRVHNDATVEEVRDVVDKAVRAWTEEGQQYFAFKAAKYYDFRYLGQQLACDIETLRSKYT